MDQDGYQVVKRRRASGNYMPEIFAVDRFTDREVKIGQTLLGSMGSRVRLWGRKHVLIHVLVCFLILCSLFLWPHAADAAPVDPQTPKSAKHHVPL